MSLTRWILDRWPRRRAALPRRDEVILYLRRLEDRRVLSLSVVDDAYFVEAYDQMLSASAQVGVLANDSDPGSGDPLMAISGFYSTDQGGTVELEADGSFTYTRPTDPSLGPVFVDRFTYDATITTETATATVTFYVGQIVLPSDQATALPIFAAETQFPSETVLVSLITGNSDSSLTVQDSGSAGISGNGTRFLDIIGPAHEVNKVLRTLVYDPGQFAGYDDVSFRYSSTQQQQQQRQPESNGPDQVVPLIIVPQGGFDPNVSLITMDDEYYFDEFDPQDSTPFVFPDNGVISNDFASDGGFVYALRGTITTDLGGMVELFPDGGFRYQKPDNPNLGPSFVDSFTYFAGTGDLIGSSEVTVFVGNVPILEDQPELLPLFSVLSSWELPQALVTVKLTSAEGASLLLLDDTGIVFNPTTPNGGSTIIFSGMATDVNFALDLLVYAPPLDYSGGDLVTIEYDLFGMPFEDSVPIDVLPVADAPTLSITPGLVDYLPQIPVGSNIDVQLVDVDGSEFLGLVILTNVPQGVFPSVGQPSPNDPGTYFLLPGELPNLSFFVDFAAPEFFTIEVIATSIEQTSQRGVFGGPGGPLLPNTPFEPRFAAALGFLSFARVPMPDEPPPPPEFVFQLGPLSPPPPPRLIAAPGGPPGPLVIAAIIEANDSREGEETTDAPVLTSDPDDAGTDPIVSEEKDEDSSRRSSETSGIYVRKLGGDGPGQVARLPAEVSGDYPRFMAFLKTLPNGDYVVYFKQGGQSHEQAELRQVVVRVRVVNHRLNPDPGEFKPAGEVAEPPENPSTSTATGGPSEERAEGQWFAEPWTMDTPPVLFDDWARITAGAGIAVLAGRWLRTDTIDHMMERFHKKPSRRFSKRGKLHFLDG